MLISPIIVSSVVGLYRRLHISVFTLSRNRSPFFFMSCLRIELHYTTTLASNHKNVPSLASWQPKLYLMDSSLHEDFVLVVFPRLLGMSL